MFYQPSFVYDIVLKQTWRTFVWALLAASSVVFLLAEAAVVTMLIDWALQLIGWVFVHYAGGKPLDDYDYMFFLVLLAVIFLEAHKFYQKRKA